MSRPVSMRALLGFNAQVLQVAISKSQEHPWLFALTGSGIEVGISHRVRGSPKALSDVLGCGLPIQVWSLPFWCPNSSNEAPLPGRLMVQRLEFSQHLERLPPIAMTVTGSSLVLLPNPPDHTPRGLSFMLFHTMPRPQTGLGAELDILEETQSQTRPQVLIYMMMVVQLGLYTEKSLVISRL